MRARVGVLVGLALLLWAAAVGCWPEAAPGVALSASAAPGLFLDPEGLAIDARTGTIFVADEDHHAILALRPDGALVARLDTAPGVPVPGGLVSTGGSLVVLPSGRLVAIRYQDLLELTLEPRGLVPGRVLGAKGRAPGEFLGLEGLAVDAAGRLYAAEEDTLRVQVLDQDGKPLRSIPMPEEPEGLSVDGHVLWVSFAKADWVGAYDARDGKLLRRVGDGALDVPDAVLAAGDEVFVSDQGHDRVVVFGRDGELLRTIGEGELATPEDLAVGPDGLLYVADSGNRRIAVFRPADGALVRSLR